MKALGSLSAGLIRCLIPALIFLLTVVVFLPAIQNGFVNWDDDKLFLENPNYRGLGWTQLRWMFTTFYMGHYRPVTWVTFGLDYLLWGMNPLGYHLSSLVFHCVNAVLFYFVALKLLRLAMPTPAAAELPLRLAAGFAALIFSLHPLRVEAVAWASGRKDVVSVLFLLLAVLCYLRAVGDEAARRKRWMVAAIIIYAVSLLAKGIGMTLPVVLLILDVYPLRRLRGGPGKWFGPEARQVWWEKAPFFLLALAAGIIAPIAQYQLGAMKTLQEHGIVPRLAQALYGLVFYLWKTIVPVSLSPLHELRSDLDPWDRPFLLSGVVVAGISAALFVLRKRWPAGLATWACYGVMLAPVLGFGQSSVQLVADRYTYLSCLGWAVLAGAGLLYCFELRGRGRIRPRSFVFSAVGGLAVLAGLGVLTWRQTQVWHDSERLWRYVLTIDENSSYAHRSLGLIYDDQGMTEEAIGHYRLAVKFDPADTSVHNNLGLLLTKQGKLDEAIEHFRQAVKIVPADVGFHINLALALDGRGNIEEAIQHFRRSLELDPTRDEAYNIHFNLGHALARQGRFNEAETHFREALRIQPEFAEAHESLGRALARQGKIDEAVKHYNEALRILKSRSKALSPG